MNHKQHLWHNQWFRDLMFVIVVVVLLALVYSLRAILLPIVMALALAYAFHPLITWLQRRAKIPRWLSTTGLLAITCAVALSMLVWITPQLISQTRSLMNRLPGYTHYANEQIEDLREWADQRGRDIMDHTSLQSTTQPAAEPTSQPTSQPATSAGQALTPDAHRDNETDFLPEPSSFPADQSNSNQITPTTRPGSATQATQVASTTQATQPSDETSTSSAGSRKNPLANAFGNIDMSTFGSMFMQTFNIGLNVVGTTISVGMYLALAGMLLLFGFFFFSWKFDHILLWFDGFIPDRNRERTMHILRRMDRAISAFVRGRLLQVSLLTTILCIGWAWVGVPYWLLLGVFAGLLNFVPYAAVFSWPVAVLLMWIDTASGGSGVTFTFAHVFVWPSVVYLVAQGLDGWVVEPLVQGKATNLDPFSVLVAVIIGGSLLGIMGTIIAVPTAACLKIFLEEVVLPRVRNEIHQRHDETDPLEASPDMMAASADKSQAPPKG